MFALLALSPSFARPAGFVVVDGEFADWSEVPVVASDPADASGHPVDFGRVRITHDADAVYLGLEFYAPVNLTALASPAEILIDADGNAGSGWSTHGLGGVDIVIELSPVDTTNPRVPGYGICARVAATRGRLATGDACLHPEQALDPDNRGGVWRVSSYELGLHVAPTHSSDRFEIRLERHRVPSGTRTMMFAGTHFNAKLVAVDLAGRVVDETLPFTHALPRSAAVDRGSNGDSPALDPLARPLETTVRVLSWNVSRESLLDDVGPFARTLAAVAPDVVLFDEISDRVGEERLRDALSELDGNNAWNIVLGTAGGSERCMVASRYPVDRLAEVAWVDYSDKVVERWLESVADAETREVLKTNLPAGMPAVGAVVDVDGFEVMTVPLDFVCCGNDVEGPQEQRRLMEARLLRSAVWVALDDTGADGVIVAGDFNLVGTRLPVEIVTGGLDPDGSDLTIVPALQNDGVSNATWASDGSPFPPGRLDFMLFSGSSMELSNAFVFDSSDLAPRWLQEYKIEAADSAAASDHRPVVADFRFRR